MFGLELTHQENTRNRPDLEKKPDRMLHRRDAEYQQYYLIDSMQILKNTNCSTFSIKRTVWLKTCECGDPVSFELFSLNSISSLPINSATQHQTTLTRCDASQADNMSFSLFNAWVVTSGSLLYQVLFRVNSCLFVLVASIIVYRLYFHPLARVPGPRFAAVSSFWHAYHARNGRMAHLGKTLHYQYGSAVRVGPNEVWFNSKEAFQAIYSVLPSKTCAF